MIKKILKISKFGVFKSFEWDNVLKRNGRAVEFSKLNIIYGRNYSGKTTLSRVVRCLETGVVHPDYVGGEFSCELDQYTVNQSNLADRNHNVRVFNRDFVKENLQILLSDQGEITPFAILGGDNIKIEAEIKSLEERIGKKDEKTGQEQVVVLAEEEHKERKNDHKKKDDLLIAKLKAKAKLIKENRSYGVVVYGIDILDKDIKTVQETGYTSLSDKEYNYFLKISEEKTKDPIDYSYNLSSLNIHFDKQVIELLKTKVSPTVRLDELAENSNLQNWVRTGMFLNKERSSCGFCGNELTEQLWKKLKEHFSEESEELTRKLQNARNELFKIMGPVELMSFPDKSELYTKFHEEHDGLATEKNLVTEGLVSLLNSLIKSIDEKLLDVFKPVDVKVSNSMSDFGLLELIEKISQLVEKSNRFEGELAKNQLEAREKLRLNEVARYIDEVGYQAEFNEVELAKNKMEKADKDKNDNQKTLEGFKEQLRRLESELKDEKKGAERINQYLSSYFGHDSIKLIHEEADGRGTFRIKRSDQDAKNLSEGESSLIAFCYFMARLHDLNTQKEETIIWIDDPISSLDNNHIFFIFSLIEKELARPVDTGNGNKYFYKQLFLSTHNLDFLKYLKRLSHPHKKVDTKKVMLVEHFIVERAGADSSLKLMPQYLEQYATEFNYLFDKIRLCADAPMTEQNYDTFYNFGNNLRKFLESYLFYRYPSLEDTDKKIRRFFEDTAHNALVVRIANEMSHAEGTVERSAMPVDIPESKKVAQFVLAKIKEKDPEQFKAFMHSMPDP